MKLSTDDIKQILRQGAGIGLRTDDFRFSELFEFAKCAFSNSAKLTLTIGDNITTKEILTLARIARHNLTIIMP